MPRSPPPPPQLPPAAARPLWPTAAGLHAAGPVGQPGGPRGTDACARALCGCVRGAPLVAAAAVAAIVLLPVPAKHWRVRRALCGTLCGAAPLLFFFCCHAAHHAAPPAVAPHCLPLLLLCYACAPRAALVVLGTRALLPLDLSPILALPASDWPAPAARPDGCTQQPQPQPHPQPPQQQPQQQHALAGEPSTPPHTPRAAAGPGAGAAVAPEPFSPISPFAAVGPAAQPQPPPPRACAPPYADLRAWLEPYDEVGGLAGTLTCVHPRRCLWPACGAVC